MGKKRHTAEEAELERNLTRKPSAADLATICDLSVGYFIAAFTEALGKPPHHT